MARLRAAVIGAGYLGRFHAEKYAVLEDTVLTAVVDPIAERARGLAVSHGARAYTDHLSVLDRIDLASIVVPTEAHFEIARACLEAGVHVLIEKPMTRTVEEADALIRIARQRGLVLQVGHLERFNPALQALAGTLKKPLFIESHRIASFQPRGTDVSVVLDLMIHDIDIVLTMVKSELSAIRAVGVPVLSPEVDIANARLEFQDGCVANVTASRVSHSPMRKVRVFQADAYISIDYQERTIAIARREADPAAEPYGFRIVQEARSFEHSDPLGLELRAFATSVRDGTAPVVSGEDGRRALQVALAVGEGIEATARARQRETSTQPVDGAGST
ncbi:MAG: Gfo/Idh/MocA family oxidoreductase [Gammaproteobacteria bacterium]